MQLKSGQQTQVQHILVYPGYQLDSSLGGDFGFPVGCKVGAADIGAAEVRDTDTGVVEVGAVAGLSVGFGVTGAVGLSDGCKVGVSDIGAVDVGTADLGAAGLGGIFGL